MSSVLVPSHPSPSVTFCMVRQPGSELAWYVSRRQGQGAKRAPRGADLLRFLRVLITVLHIYTGALQASLHPLHAHSMNLALRSPVQAWANPRMRRAI